MDINARQLDALDFNYLDPGTGGGGDNGGGGGGNDIPGGFDQG